mgnify:CR=1 FL=1
MKLTEPQALNRAAAYCSKAERCEYDVRKKLISWELPDDAVSRIIKRLKDERFLSDERFSRSFINDKMRFNKWGRTKIIYELSKRNISESVYLPILDEVSGNEFEEQLMHILRVKARTVKGKNEYDKKTKLIRFAVGRGFSLDMSIKGVNKIMGGDYEEDIL